MRRKYFTLESAGSQKKNGLISIKSLYEREVRLSGIKEKTFSAHNTLGGHYATIAAGGLFYQICTHNIQY